MLPEMERLISAFKLRLRMHSPFFATLALFAGYRQREDIPQYLQKALPGLTEELGILSVDSKELMSGSKDHQVCIVVGSAA